MLVVPFQSVGDFYFNDTRGSLRSKVDERFQQGVKGGIDYYDFFPESDFFIYYDENDKVNAFEFFSPRPIFNGVNLLMEPFESLVKTFSELDSELQCSSTEFTSYKFGIGANASFESESDILFPEAIIIFRKEYYAGSQELLDKLL